MPHQQRHATAHRAAAANQRMGEPVGGGVQVCVSGPPSTCADGRARRMPRRDLREIFGKGLFHVAQIFIGHGPVGLAGKIIFPLG